MSSAEQTSKRASALAPATRITAYVILWGLLLGILWWRRAPAPELVTLPTAERGPEFRIHLNDDPWERIALIEGIGESLARKIVAAREQRGRFQSLEEIKELPGVPDRPIEEAAAYLTLEAER